MQAFYETFCPFTCKKAKFIIFHLTACADNCKTCNDVSTLQCDGATTYPTATDTTKGCMPGYLYKTGASGQADYCHDGQFTLKSILCVSAKHTIKL